MLQAASDPPFHSPGYSTSHLSIDSSNCPLAEDSVDYPPTEDPSGHLLAEDPPDLPYG